MDAMDPVIVVARGAFGRLRGLIGRSGEVALLIPRCRSVHTFFMRCALDLLWLDGAGRVVRIDRGVPPWRVRSCRSARSVLECAAGSAAEVLRVTERQDVSGPPSRS